MNPIKEALTLTAIFVLLAFGMGYCSLATAEAMNTCQETHSYTVCFNQLNN